MNETFKVGDSVESNDNHRYYGMNNFIIGYRFQINGSTDKAIRNIEASIEDLNKIEEKTESDLKLLENCREKLRGIITKNETQFTDHYFELDDLYEKFTDFYIKKIAPNMTVNGERNQISHKNLKNFFIKDHKKITGELFKSKWT